MSTGLDFDPAWTYGAIQFDAPAGFTVDNLDKVPTTKTIPLPPASQLGFDARVLPGTHITLGGRVFKVTDLSNDRKQITVSDLIGKTAAAKTRLRQAKKKDCMSPGFGGVLSVSQVGGGPFSPRDFLIVATFSAKIDWDVFVASATLSSPPGGKNGTWFSGDGEAAGWNVGTLGQGPEAHWTCGFKMKNAILSLGNGFTLEVTAEAGFPDSAGGQDICGGQYSVTKKFVWLGGSVVKSASPPPST